MDRAVLAEDVELAGGVLAEADGGVDRDAQGHVLSQAGAIDEGGPQIAEMKVGVGM